MASCGLPTCALRHLHEDCPLRLIGSYTALATPFDEQSQLDIDAWVRMVEAQRSGGSAGIVVGGSTGEGQALEEAELAQLLSVALRYSGNMTVIAGTGHSSTRKTILQTQFARQHGAQAALVVTPPYVRPTQEGLYRHYIEVAERGGLPVILYNVPARTGCDLQPSTVARLAEVESIVGIKEANVAEERLSALLPMVSSRFSLLSGDDATAAQSILAGAQGVVSVASNILPATFRRLCDHALAGNADLVAARMNALMPLLSFLGVESNPIPLKALLASKGLGSDVPRLPLTKLSAEHRLTMEAMLPTLVALEFSAAAELAALSV
ncbi:MAG: 4-hydroxy-tetrahydrodipicolinate synthase [Xanthomonadales bacterium]|nr:4-hydroxy-tetrahydrodipicolinate synthase [Xanthomonadales bacterium]